MALRSHSKMGNEFCFAFFFSSLIDLAGRCSYWRDAGKRKWADILGKWGNRTGQEVVPEVSARSELEPYQAWVSQFGAHCFTTGRAVWTVRTFPIDLSHLQQVLPIGYSFWKILLKKKTKQKQDEGFVELKLQITQINHCWRGSWTCWAKEDELPGK